MGAEERERPFGPREIVEPGIPISRKDPGLYRRTLVVIHVLDRVSSDGDDHEPGSDGNGLLPVRSATIGSKVRLFEFQAVGDDLIVIGSRDHELAGRFVIRVVEGGKPVMRFVGPVIGRERSLAVFVVGNDKSIGRNATIADRVASPLPRFSRRERRDVNPIVLVGKSGGLTIL